MASQRAMLSYWNGSAWTNVVMAGTTTTALVGLSIEDIMKYTYDYFGATSGSTSSEYASHVPLGFVCPQPVCVPRSSG